MLKQTIETIGAYTLLMGRVFRTPIRWHMFYKELVRAIYQQGVGSIPIVILVSFFIGAVITMQLGINITTPLVPKFAIGYTAREVMILEFSSTIMCMILAGKCGSSIASEIGTMKVTEQLDAMEIMGVNSANYVILPKVVGMILFVPCLVIMSMFVGIAGGYMSATIIPDMPIDQFVEGLRLHYRPYGVFYSIVKSIVYVFFISTISAFYGYNVEGGSLQVGQASTSAVVISNGMILLSDMVLTQLLLA